MHLAHVRQGLVDDGEEDGIGLVLARGNGNGGDRMGAPATIPVEMANWLERGVAALGTRPNHVSSHHPWLFWVPVSSYSETW